jgi:hypothetical protein
MLADPAPTRRRYHWSALLLPDGRVWHGGSTTTAEAKNLNIEVFTPHYADDVEWRPTISKCPPNIGCLHQFDVETQEAGSIARIALMRYGSITHGFDSNFYGGAIFRASDQKFIEMVVCHRFNYNQ